MGLNPSDFTVIHGWEPWSILSGWEGWHIVKLQMTDFTCFRGSMCLPTLSLVCSCRVIVEELVAGESDLAGD